MCFDQDTWLINISNDGKHYAKMILPPDLSKKEAQAEAELVYMAFEMLKTDGKFEISLTRWELRGREISF